MPSCIYILHNLSSKLGIGRYVQSNGSLFTSLFTSIALGKHRCVSVHERHPALWLPISIYIYQLTYLLIHTSIYLMYLSKLSIQAIYPMHLSSPFQLPRWGRSHSFCKRTNPPILQNWFSFTTKWQCSSNALQNGCAQPPPGLSKLWENLVNMFFWQK